MTPQETKLPTVEELLEASAATPEFKEAVLQFARSKSPDPRLQFSPGNPPVKVLRAICGLLEAQPRLAIDSVKISASAGCSDYRGTLTVNDSTRFNFVWDCAWKANQLGWKDYFGNPDQPRAAQTFGYRCFEVFEEVK